MTDWNQLRIALAVIECGGVGAAATRLGVSPATVSRNLHALETELGQAILDRTPGRVRITAFGASIVDALQRAEQALMDVDRAAARHTGALAGRVRLATMPMLAADFLVPHLPAFYAHYPDIRIELLLHHDVVNLGRGDADLALRGARPTQENLISKRVRTDELGAWVAPSLLATHPDPSTVPWVAWPSSTGVLETRWLDQHIPQERVVLQADDARTLAVACREGLGATLLTAQAAQLYGLVPLPGGPRGPELPLWLVMPESLRGVPRMDAVWDWISAHFAGAD